VGRNLLLQGVRKMGQAGECAGLIQAEPDPASEPQAGGPERLLPEVLHEGLPENSPQEAAHVVPDSRKQRNAPAPASPALWPRALPARMPALRVMRAAAVSNHHAGSEAAVASPRVSADPVPLASCPP
jgi:hypothetical protein